MPKTKNILVSSILAVYFGLIGTNLVWQHGDGIFGAALSADSAESGDELEGPDLEAIQAEQDAADAAAKAAMEAAKKKAAADAAARSAERARSAIAEAAKTDAQQAITQQGSAYETALCKQKPEACAVKPAIDNPKYKSIIDKAKKYKEQAEKLKNMVEAVKIEAQAKKAAADRVAKEVAFAKRFNLALSSKTVAASENLREQAANDCLARMSSLSDMEAAQKAAEAEAERAKPAGLQEGEPNFCEDVEEGDDCELGVPSTTVSSDPEKRIPDVDENAVIAAEIKAEQQRQAAIQASCAELTAATNSVQAGSKDYAALQANLRNLSNGIDTTSSRAQAAANSARIAAESNAEKQGDAADQEMMAKNKAAAATQLAANKAKADAASEEAEGPSPIPIGFSNTGLNGEKIIPSFEGDVIPIIPTIFDNRYLMPSWNYSYSYGEGGVGSMNSPGMSPADLGYP